MSQATLTFDVQRNAHQASDARRNEILADPGFGRYTTDHMISMLYSHDRGWYDAAVLGDKVRLNSPRSPRARARPRTAGWRRRVVLPTL